jgi:hypothetical protein
MTKSIMLALATAGALFCSANANAGGHVSWSVGINAPAVGAVISNGPAYGYGYGYPVYESYPVYAPAPVYYQPARWRRTRAIGADRLVGGRPQRVARPSDWTLLHFGRR